MKDFDGIIITLGGIAVAVALYLGVTSMIKQSLKNAPKSERMSTSEQYKQQRVIMKETTERNRQLMDQQRQKMKDFRNRN